MQIIAKTNILFNTSSKNDLPELLKRPEDSDKYIKQVTQMPHPLKSVNFKFKFKFKFIKTSKRISYNEHRLQIAS